MEIIIAGAAALAVLMIWCLWTVARLDRLATRVGSARASLDAQLVRRAAAAQAIAATGALEPPLETRLRAAVRAAIGADEAGREAAENDLGSVLRAVPATVDPALLGDLADASARVALARRFYNDAVRDTRALRSARVSRLIGLVSSRPEPAFFEIADGTGPAPDPRRPVGGTSRAA
ncbi:MAG TPA: hypothetical protein VHC49_17290 [Mycobacteriales bacterium]|nr:hypothetical protein [Mycobacteriales bacterium]